jgi:hypothetical protein
VDHVDHDDADEAEGDADQALHQRLAGDLADDAAAVPADGL